MSRTNIDIDDELVGRVMKRNGLPTKRAAVDWALRMVDAEPLSMHEALNMQGVGWNADLDDMRSASTTLDL